mgnify:CR=1 FL=1
MTPGPSGYTLLIGSPGPLVIAPVAGAAGAPDPLRALVPVALLAESPHQTAGIRVEHVPYRRTGAAIPDVMAGKVEAMFGDISALLPLVEAGGVRALATTAPARTPLAPDIPTTTEAGSPAIIVRNWQAALASPGTPDAVLRRRGLRRRGGGRRGARRAGAPGLHTHPERTGAPGGVPPRRARHLGAGGARQRLAA